MIKQTLEQVKDMGIVVGLEPEKAEEWYHHYKAQGWKYPSGLEITDVYSALFRWQNNQYKFAKKANGKKKLLPIIGKTCSEKDCRLPAVYKDTSGNYDYFRCAKHLPAEVKAEFY